MGVCSTSTLYRLPYQISHGRGLSQGLPGQKHQDGTKKKDSSKALKYLSDSLVFGKF